jgi:hypothetical protein
VSANPCGNATKHTSRIGCCAGCKRLFSSDSAFDRHRRGGECMEPQDVGLIPRQSRTAEDEVIFSLPGGYFDEDAS